MQQHVSTRTSTQARSHAQKFFGKLDKKQLTLDEFLERLDIEQLKVDLRLNDAGDSTEYNEDQPLITIANQKHKSSVMNIALPQENHSCFMLEPKIIKSPCEIICDERMPEEYRITTVNEPIEISANGIALSNMRLENEEKRNIHTGSKRSLMQRRAKTNHAFFSK